MDDEGVLSDSTTTTVDTPPSERIDYKEEEKMNNNNNVNFVSRVSSIPIIHDGVSFANKTSLGKFISSTTNSTLSTVNKYQPKYIQSYYEQYIQPHIEKVDEIGCKSLDLIQNKYPILNQPTNEIVDSSKNVLNSKISTVVTSVETVMDKYLPNQQPQQPQDDVSKAYYLLNDIKSRITQRIPNTYLNETSVLLQKTNDNIHSILNNKNEHIDLITQQISNQLNTILTYIKKQSDEKSPDWLKARFISIIEITNQQLLIIRAQYSRKDINSIEKAKHIMNAIQVQVLPILQNLQSQLAYYSEIARQKASNDLTYLGSFIHTPKLTSAQ